MILLLVPIQIQTHLEISNLKSPHVKEEEDMTCFKHGCVDGRTCSSFVSPQHSMR